MPIQPSASTENNFIEGLRTEFTGLNFPENAAIDLDNVVISLIGEVERRGGFNIENNGTYTSVNVNNRGISQYHWKNAGGDGLTQIVVVQVGELLRFFLSSSATTGSPLSQHMLGTIVNLSTFQVNPIDISQECQFADGNGYLFVFHPSCDPIYITFNNTTQSLIANRITVQIRDFVGVPDGFPVDYRPLQANVNNEHVYNLFNQGWTNVPSWSTTSSDTQTIGLGLKNFTVASVVGIFNGDPCVAMSTGNVLGGGAGQMTGTINNIAGNVITISVASVQGAGTFTTWAIAKNTGGLIDVWRQATGSYPANSDVWWLYKAPTGTGGLMVYNPQATIVSGIAVSQPQAQAPQGSFVLNAFNQQRTLVSGVGGINDVSTTVRPRTGTWFEGRVWFAGVDANFPQQGDQPFSTWTENLYFSQIVTDTTDFAKCYQQNDPTSQDLFDLLPTDGGVITIQGCGSIYKLFPVVNGMLVFASNGIWFITGSQGIGFRANDYTITKISGVRIISNSSFVNVNGWPIFWNNEGIYTITPGQGGGLQVENICVGTILTFYTGIPLQSKKFAKGAYDPLSFIVQWTFKSTPEQSVTDRYIYDKVLSLNIHNKSFYTYTVPTGNPRIAGVLYVESPGGSVAPDPIFKYLTYASSSAEFTFSEESDFTTYTDFFSFDGVGVNFVSHFVTGYKLRPIRHPYLGMYGQAPQKYQPIWLYMWSRNEFNGQYKVKGVWDYATAPDSGKFSNEQVVTVGQNQNFGKAFRRLKVRGHGRVFQLFVTSVDGKPFQLMGWSMVEAQNVGV